MLSKFFSFLIAHLPSGVALAHCDVPCGIYDPKASQTASQTVLKMVQLINALPTDNPSIDDRAKFIRCVTTKEEHAQKCKQELLILWTDYFKPEHLEKFPDLHDTFWKAAKLCSENKQHISEESAQKLVDAVNTIADMFAQTRAAK